MAWPAGAVDTTDTDDGTDNPQNARLDVLDALQKLNQIIGHVTTFGQSLIDDADATAARATLGAAPLVSPTFTGTPAAPTPAGGDNDTSIATTAFVQGELAAKAPLASPTFTGAPAAPTPSPGDNTTKLATTGFVKAAIDVVLGGVSAAFDTLSEIATELGLKAPLASPTFTGTPLETMGTGSGTASLIGKASINTTAVGNVGTGTDDLMSYLLLANSLSANGKGIRVKGWGITAPNANSKTLTFNWGSLSHGFVMTASISGNWIWEIEIFRTGSNAQRIFYRIMEATDNSGGLVTPKAAQVCNQVSSQTDSADITVKFTGAATANNDIVQEGMLVEYIG